MAHVVEIMEKTWLSAELRETVDLTTTFPMVSWEELPVEADSPRTAARFA